MKISDKITQRKRQRKKIISTNTAIKLKVFVENNFPEDKAFIKRMVRQIRCTIRLEVFSNGIVKSHFCGQKTCLVCNSIRLGKFLNIYLDKLKEEKVKYHMVLTIKNPDENNLKAQIDKMYKFFNQSSIKKNENYKRLNKIIKMIRSFEATFNSNAKTYHIHFHVLIAGEYEDEVKQYGELLIEYWLKYFKGYADIQAQYLAPQDKNILENFKYLFKLKDLTEENIYMVYKLLRATDNKRLFTAKNIKRSNVAKSWDEVKIKDVDEMNDEVVDKFYYDKDINNWVSWDSGEILIDESISENSFAVKDKTKLL